MLNFSDIFTFMFYEYGLRIENPVQQNDLLTNLYFSHEQVSSTLKLEIILSLLYIAHTVIQDSPFLFYMKQSHTSFEQHEKNNV